MTNSPTPTAPGLAPMRPELRAHLVRMGMLAPNGSDVPAPTGKPPEAPRTEPKEKSKAEGYFD